METASGSDSDSSDEEEGRNHQRSPQEEVGVTRKVTGRTRVLGVLRRVLGVPTQGTRCTTEGARCTYTRCWGFVRYRRGRDESINGPHRENSHRTTGPPAENLSKYPRPKTGQKSPFPTGGSPTEKKWFPRKLRKTNPDSVVTFFLLFWDPCCSGTGKGPCGAACLLDPQAPAWCLII